MALSTGAQFIQQLLDAADPERLKAFFAAVNSTNVKPEPKPKPQHGPVITYTTVHKEYTCLICHTKITKTFKLGKGEELISIDHSGNCHVMHGTGKTGEITIPCTTTRCEQCFVQVHKWSREELENNFMLLLSQMAFREKADYVKARTIVREEGMIRI
jgi:hypothetical protein